MVDPATGDGAPVVGALPAKIDFADADDVYDQLSAAVRSGAPVIIADLTATTLCDSAGVHCLLLIQARATAGGVQVRVVIPSGATVSPSLELMGARSVAACLPEHRHSQP